MRIVLKFIPRVVLNVVVVWLCTNVDFYIGLIGVMSISVEGEISFWFWLTILPGALAALALLGVHIRLDRAEDSSFSAKEAFVAALMGNLLFFLILHLLLLPEEEYTGFLPGFEASLQTTTALFTLFFIQLFTLILLDRFYFREKEDKEDGRNTGKYRFFFRIACNAFAVLFLMTLYYYGILEWVPFAQGGFVRTFWLYLLPNASILLALWGIHWIFNRVKSLALSFRRGVKASFWSLCLLFSFSDFLWEITPLFQSQKARDFKLIQACDDIILCEMNSLTLLIAAVVLMALIGLYRLCIKQQKESAGVGREEE